LTLTASDGTKLMAFAAHAANPAPGSPAVVVMPDVRGLYSFYEELGLRFAENGIEAAVIDYFGRTTDLGSSRSDEFDFMSQIAHTSPPTVAADVGAAVDYLRGLGPAGRPIFTVGFCFGGTHSWLQAASGHGLAGVVGFYGMPTGSPFPLGKDLVPPISRVNEYQAPVLALQGGNDPYIPTEHADQFRDALRAAGVENEVVVYPGAPHSFFDREQATYQKESDDAWRRIKEFISAHS
jgi:carboxymethylenebutenolidase